MNPHFPHFPHLTLETYRKVQVWEVWEVWVYFALSHYMGMKQKTKKRLLILYCAHFFVFLQPTNVRLLRNEQRNAPKRLKK